jgi:hypothetical protein
MTTKPAGSDLPSDGLSDSDIALLMDIGEYAPDGNDPRKQSRIERLIASGFVECSHADMAATGAKFMLTRKAQDLLSERGAGLNEA